MNITKQQYLEYRKTNNFPLELPYHIYTSKCEKDCVDFSTFLGYVQYGIPLQIKTHFGPVSQKVFMNKKVLIDRTIEYFDDYFGVIELKDKKGETIKWL